MVIPAYNAEKTISACVSSIVCQSYSSLDIIIVDDGSKDSTQSICCKMKDLDPRIRVVGIANSGPSAARNVGFRHSLGEWMLFVDADDELVPDAVEQIVEVSECVDMIAFGWKVVNDDKKDATYTIIPRIEGIAAERDLLVENISGSLRNYIWCYAYRAEFLQSVFANRSPFPEEYVLFEDGIFLHRLLRAAKIKTYFLQKPLVVHHEMRQSLSKRVDVSVARAALRSLNEFEAMTVPEGLMPRWRGKCIRMAINAYNVAGTDRSEGCNRVRGDIRRYICSQIARGHIEGLTVREVAKVCLILLWVYPIVLKLWLTVQQNHEP